MNLLRKFVDKASLLELATATAAYVVMNAIINYSSIGVAGLLKVTGGASILDFELGYSAAKAYQMLDSLGEAGRDFYLSKILLLDFPFPAAYALFFSCFIAFLLKIINSNKPFLNLLLLLPIAAMLCDWAENACIIVMLTQYPAVLSNVCAIGSFLTVMKIIFSYASVISILILSAAAIVLYAKRRLYTTLCKEKKL